MVLAINILNVAALFTGVTAVLVSRRSGSGRAVSPGVTALLVWIASQAIAVVGGLPAGFHGFGFDSVLQWLGRLGAVLGVIVTARALLSRRDFRRERIATENVAADRREWNGEQIARSARAGRRGRR